MMRVMVAPGGPPLPSAQPPCSRYVKVNLLSGPPLYFVVEAKWKCKELYSQVCRELRRCHGMQDTDLFGLATLLDGEYVFTEPDYKLSKYAPKSWRSSSTNGLDSSGKPQLEFFFQVQFYVESPLLLRDELSLEHYFTQMEKNVSERGLGSSVGTQSPATQKSLLVLAGLALQARHGDATQPTLYQKPEQFIPQQIVTSCGEERARALVAGLHRANAGLPQAQARLQYVREASLQDLAPHPFNTHVFKLRASKTDPPPGSVSLAISSKGIHLSQENSSKPLNGTFLWNDIGKLCFDRKKFEIRGVNSQSNDKYSYYTSSDEKSKHLLSLCKATHQHSMAIQPRLAQVRGREESERKQSRDWGLEAGKWEQRYCGTGEQRISVISSNSSTTTSGIVSDRVHSLDESEDDLELDIMIKSGSGGSLECSSSGGTPGSGSRPPPPPPTDPASTPSTPSSRQYSGSGESVKPGPSGDVTSLAVTTATDGSQCSSSASTVVVHQPPENVVNLMRCESVTSSLELGYSHTAEHSTISESNYCEPDCSVRSAQASSGVYTLDTTTENCDNCDDAQTAIDTVASSSGIGLDSHGSQRSRSGSLVSHSGSFHGDGSDPSEAGQGNPLSAEELSNLIVNPGSPRPRRGVYPNRATVSSTLDSCSDYVTLPPPPQPPAPQPPPPQPPATALRLPPAYPLHTLPGQATARFISTKPQISVLTAHSTRLPTSPSYATTGPRLKVNMIPLVTANNYLDFRGPYRQPPPPPPRPNVATVYTSQVTQSQIEQFKRQLYSDVDYVVYPMKDPALSKQEYLDSKFLTYRYTPPPPYPSKNLIYRSTPNVAVASSLLYNKFASNQNLSDYYVSTSPLVSAAASYSSSSTQSLRYDPLLPTAPVPPVFHRTLSHDDILNSDRPIYRTTLYRRPPPPAPPTHLPDPFDLILDAVPSTSAKSTPIKVSDLLNEVAAGRERGLVDISTLREKSRNLDLPLISALCNDKSLLKQTKAFVVPQHPALKEPAAAERKSLLSTLLSKSSGSSTSSKLKYPVSGLSTNQIVKAGGRIRRPISRHKHPQPHTKINSASFSSYSKEPKL